MIETGQEGTSEEEYSTGRNEGNINIGRGEGVIKTEQEETREGDNYRNAIQVQHRRGAIEGEYVARFLGFLEPGCDQVG